MDEMIMATTTIIETCSTTYDYRDMLDHINTTSTPCGHCSGDDDSDNIPVFAKRHPVCRELPVNDNIAQRVRRGLLKHIRAAALLCDMHDEGLRIVVCNETTR